MTNAIENPKSSTADMKFEIVVIPVSDVDRAKAFYANLGWRLDADYASGDDFRVIQFTPPGSGCSVIFGKNVTAAAPGSAQGLYLIVSDIEAARSDLLARGVKVSEVFHDAGGVYAGAGRALSVRAQRVSGRGSRASQLSLVRLVQRSRRQWLAVPGGHGAIARTRGRDDTTFTSSTELAAALRRAAAAHGEHEKRNGGQYDANWPDWYAEYIVREQAGKPLPL